MESKQTLFESMNELWTELSNTHPSSKFTDAKRARKAASSLKKLISEYNKASVAEEKAAKEAKKQA